MTNPHLSPPSPVGGVVGHNIDRRIIESPISDRAYIILAVGASGLTVADLGVINNFLKSSLLKLALK